MSATIKTTNKLAIAQQQAAKLIEEATEAVKQEAAKHLNSLSTCLAGIPGDKIGEILSDTKIKSLLSEVGLRFKTGTATPSKPNKPAKRAKKGTRGKPVEGVTGNVLKKIKDKEIKDYIGKEEKMQSDLFKKYGQLIPGRLAAMKQAGLLTVRKDGIKKLWKVA